jgi:antitoxin component HigA of HigAB toxin-antitoxin module
MTIKPIRSERDHKAALSEMKRLWGARLGTPAGDRLDVLATLVDAYESRHHLPAPSDRPSRPRGSHQVPLKKQAPPRRRATP